MQSGFDPYREWLDIPDATETPNHYRLLGLRLFEDDRNLIGQAVARVGKVLSRRLSGPHQAEAKRLLSELDLARGCLADAAAKQQYDQLLRAELLSEPIAVSPKSTFVSQAKSDALLPPSEPPRQGGSLRSTFNATPAGAMPLPPSAAGGQARGRTDESGSSSEPAMRVTVQQSATPLMPPSMSPPTAPAALPPSAFGPGKSSGGTTSPSTEDTDDMLPPAALPASFAAAPTPPSQAQAIPAAYAIPLTTSAQPYAQPAYGQPVYGQPSQAYGQPLQAQPIYPASAVPAMALPAPPAGMTAIPQAVPYGAPATAYAMPAPSMAENSMADAMGMQGTPVVSESRRSWRARSSSPTALYLALPVTAVIVLLGVMLYNQQAGQNGSGGASVAHNPDSPPTPTPEPPRAVEPSSGQTDRKDQNARSVDVGPTAMTPAEPRPTSNNPAMPATVQPTPPAATPTPEVAAADDPKTQETIRQTLAEVRQALRDRKFEVAKAKIESARKASGGSKIAADVERVDALVQYVEGFWKGVDEQIKGLAIGDQTTLRDKTVGVVDKDAEKLILRVDGENRTYAREDLPIGVAIGLAEAWFNPNDPASKIFLGSIHIVHPKGDRDKARELWQQAALGGKEKEVQLVLPELDAPWPDKAAMAEAGPASRLPPKPSDLAAARTEVRQMFEADLSEASDGPAKTAVAEKMFRRADEGGDTATIRFALLAEAASMAAQGGDFDQMLAALDRQSELFEIDAVDAKSDVLFEAAKSVEGAEGNTALAQAALALYDEAVLLEQFDQAARLVRIALGAARKSGNSELIKDCSARDKEVRELLKK